MEIQNLEKYANKNKDLKIKLSIAIATFILLAPYAVFYAFGLAFIEGYSVVYPMLVVSFVIYLLIVTFLIFIQNKSRNKKIIARILWILVLIQVFFTIIGFGVQGIVLLTAMNSTYQETSILDCDEMGNEKIMTIGNEKVDISNPKDKDRCYLEVAQRDGDIKICDKINSEEIKGDCFWGIALEKDNPEYCLEAENKDYCYFGYAVKQSKDSTEDGISICKLIVEDDKLRKACCFEVLSGGDENEKNKEECLN